ncbi:oxidoreductase [Lithospermum erythrorhizon]|uniref:Oxidoreductase n=1 Tax=Lithospermum erythrorhizon TaxID=34254 RepID=A0AAV3R2T4_LITER
MSEFNSAILEAENIKRFLAWEFAIDVDLLQDPVDPAKNLFATIANFRRVVEWLGIPPRYVVANGFAAKYWPNLAQVNPSVLLPYIEQVVAYGTGNSKELFALNKNLYISPQRNALSFNELFALWEKKGGKTLSKSYVSEEDMLGMINVGRYFEEVLANATLISSSNPAQGASFI